MKWFTSKNLELSANQYKKATWVEKPNKRCDEVTGRRMTLKGSASLQADSTRQQCTLSLSR